MVSVIIPTYNYGSYISEALQSLLDQTYSDWECLIIDDGSTDNTQSIVYDWMQKDNRINYYKQQNQGPNSARNNGIEKSKGTYILFLDADDLLEADKLISHVDVLNKNNQIDIAYGDVRYFYANKPQQLFFSLKPDNKPWTIKFSGNGKQIVDTVLKQNIMVTSSPLIRKRVLQISGGFDSKLIKLEDWELFQRWAINDYLFQYVDKPNTLVLMRGHETSFSHDKKGMKSYFLPILEKHFTQSNLSIKNKTYVIVRMLEEFTDLTFALLIDSSYPPRHYYSAYKYILPVLCILLLPLYIAIKIFRLIRKPFQHD